MLIQYTLVTSRSQRPGRRWRVVPTRDRSGLLSGSKNIKYQAIEKQFLEVIFDPNERDRI